MIQKPLLLKNWSLRILCLLAVCYSQFAVAQCEVDAGTDITVCAGELITLGGSPTVVNAAGPYTISWNNGIGNDENPNFAAGSTTTYTVTLEDDNNCTDTDQVVVTVLPSPNATFVFGPDNDCAGTSVNFVNNTTACVNCEYSWNFDNPASGASNTSTQSNPSHVFVSVGNGVEVFDVTLTAESENGCISTFTSSVTVNQSPDVVLTEDANFTQCLGFADFYTYVNDASTPALNTNYIINWGDGSPDYNSATAPSNLEHIYSGINIWTLTYTVTGNNGCETVETYEVTNITNPAVGAATLGNTLQCGPVVMCFDLNSYGNNHPSTEYLVNFGDGSATQTFPHPPPDEVCHNYTTSACENNPTFYTFNITADNNCTPSTVTISPIQIYTPPIANFTAPPIACVGAAVPFTNTSIGGYNQGCNPNANWTWDFGDPASGAANTSALDSPSHVYATDGTYTVTLSATNAGNPQLACGTTEITMDICIETPPTPSFTLDEVIGCLPLQSAVTNTSDDGIPCSLSTNWEVFYSDLPCLPGTGTYSYTGGTSAASDEPVFLFQSVGIYDVVFEMTNTCGVFEDIVSVQVNTDPEIDVLELPDICETGAVSPSAAILDCGAPITNYAWNMPGGSPVSASTASPGSVNYANAGNFTVTLNATNECGTSTSSESFTVEDSPIINITPLPDDEICAGQQVTLTASGASNYVWAAAPGYVSTNGATAVVQPATTQIYSVSGTSPAGCPGSTSITIDVNPLPVISAPQIFEICVGESIEIFGDVIGGTAPYMNYSWTPPGTLSNAGISNPDASPVVDTNYTLTVTDSEGCQGSGIIPVDVNPLPVVNAGPDFILCDQPVAEELTGYTPTTNGTGVWTGTGITDPDGFFTPNGPGTFTLTYTFEDLNGCINDDTVDVDVVAPTQADAGPDLEYCETIVPINLPGVGYWSGPNVTVDGEFTASPPGDYDLTYSEGVGSCLTSDVLSITVFDLPTVTADADAGICSGDSVQLGVIVAGGELPYLSSTWNLSPDLSDPSVSNPFASPAVNAVFTYTVTDDNGCVVSDDQAVDVLPSPVVEAGPNLNLCNQPIEEILTGFSPLIGGTGVWTGPNITDPAGIFTPNGPGDFIVYYDFTGVNGCSAVDSITITVVDPAIADAGPDFALCLNDDPVFLAQPGTWTGTQVTPTGEFTPSSEGDFDLTITIGAGTCQTTDMVTVTVNPLPTADAGMDVAVCDSEEAQLDGSGDSPNLPITDYEWTGGVGLDDYFIPNPQASPSVETTYTLTVTDNAGCESSDEVTVFVNDLPVVEAGLDLELCDQPIEEILTGFSPADGVGGVGEWTGTGITDPSGIFESPGVGNYWVYYNFTDDLGCANIDSINVEVIPPTLADAGPDFDICPNLASIDLQGFSPAAGGTWSGLGITDAVLGTFNPALANEGLNTLYFEFGTGTCYSIDSLVVDILPLPVMDPGPDAEFCGNEGLVTLQDFSPAGGTWEGPGIVDASLGVFDTSIGAADYDLIYFYTDGLTTCTDTVERVVTIHPVPQAAMTVVYEACTNLNLDLSNNSIGATEYLWQFGNLVENDDIEPAYTYPDPGMYTVTLIAYNQFACSDTTETDVEAIDLPTAELALSTDEGCAPLEVEFENLSTGQYVSYLWDLSIALTADVVPDPMTYAQGDDIVIYPISLSATNYCGTDTAIDTVTVLPQPIAGFGTNLDVFCSPFEVVINNISTGLPDFYAWDFGDGTFSNLEEPGTHIYYTDTEAQDYTINLFVENECGTDTAFYTITVLPNTVTAFFNTDVTIGCSPLSVEFTDFSEGGTVITYDFGNNDITDEPNPTHVFVDPGVHTIYQYVNNGCSFDTTFIQVEVLPGPNLAFSTTEPNACINTGVQFQNESTGASDVSWDFGDMTQSEEANPLHYYENPGTYTVTLFGTSTLNECPGQVQQNFTVLTAPTAEFTVDGQVGCSPLEITFNNQTVGGLFYSWDFDDDNTSSDFEPTHTFFNTTADPAAYQVSLIVENIQLCRDTFLIDIVVSPTPIAAFDIPIAETCAQELEVQLTNNSSFANDYAWTFESQGESDLLNPTVTFDGPGTYTISLLASNSYGCEDTEAQDVTIYALPSVDFDADRYVGCVPLDVQFINQSSPGMSYEWEFGAGGDSDETNPSFVYPFFGTFDVSLTAISDEGCENSLTIDDMITVHPQPIADFAFSPDNGSLFAPVIDFTDLSFGAQFYLWSFGDGNVSTDQNPQHAYNQSGEYQILLEVVSSFGCESDKVDFLTITESNNVYVPTAFTPDGDGINDYFFPELVGSVLEFYEFQIFDRWGEKIFETNDHDEPWVGNYKGGDYYVKDDVYVWQLRVQWQGSTETDFYIGRVTLIK